MLGQRPDLFQLLEELPVSRYLKTLSYRVNQLKNKLNRSAYYDQYAGKSVPYNYSLLYGPINLTTPRRQGTTGFLGLATVADPSAFILPRNGNVLTGRDGVFMWHSTNMTTFINWTRTAQTGGGWPAGPVTALPPGDIFSSVVDMNGGGQVLQNICDIGWGAADIRAIDSPSLNFDVDLYDRKRGRSITGGRVPAETFFGGTMGACENAMPYRWEPDTEIEPRIYVNQARAPLWDTVAETYDQNTTLFNKQQVQFYLTLTFKGELLLEERPND